MTTFWPCPEVVTISDNQCKRSKRRAVRRATLNVRLARPDDLRVGYDR